ncbi:MAG: spondin domain-containing protein [Gemmatimonadota bacterium]|jgi:hypothetical protein
MKLRLRNLAMITAAVSVAACGDTPTPTATTVPEALQAQRGADQAERRTYEVTVTNDIAEGQWLTPPLVVLHQRAEDVFTVGKKASFEVKEIAENGNLGPMLELLGASRHVSDFAVLPPPPPPTPLMGGQTVSVELTAEPGARFVSFISMLICTNDGFTGLDGVHLPPRVGQSVVLTADAYDAGTEMNTEDFTDLVPPCQVITNGSVAEPGSGMSNPALMEGGVIHHHDGILGGADLDPAFHGWDDPVVTIEIVRTS